MTIPRVELWGALDDIWVMTRGYAEWSDPKQVAEAVRQALHKRKETMFTKQVEDWWQECIGKSATVLFHTGDGAVYEGKVAACAVEPNNQGSTNAVTMTVDNLVRAINADGVQVPAGLLDGECNANAARANMTRRDPATGSTVGVDTSGTEPLVDEPCHDLTSECVLLQHGCGHLWTYRVPVNKDDAWWSFRSAIDGGCRCPSCVLGVDGGGAYDGKRVVLP